MSNKIIALLYFILIAVLIAFAYKYIQVQDYKLIATEKLQLLQKAIDNFNNVGFVVVLVSCILSNYNVVKTKKLFFVWMPLLYVIVVAVLFNKHEDSLFDFKKANGLWKGDFSLTFLFAIFFIIAAVIILTINYFALKTIINNNNRTVNDDAIV
jgi:hypothetical protein